MLQLTGVSKRYGGVTALAPIDLALAEAKTYVLLGTSGCGKSTLLKSAIGLIEADSGAVRLDGQELTRDNAPALRQRIGYVPQDGGLFPHLTAGANVAVLARYLGWRRDRITERTTELAELVQLPAALLDRYPTELSGGQRQRVGLMRALMLDPDLLLMDEPLGALDPIIRSELQTDLRAIFRKLQKTVVIVTHDVHEAAYFADEVLLMRAGRVVQRGPMAELLAAPADPFVTQFIRAQRTVLEGDPFDEGTPT
ncbi:MAG: ATP-binding cassette domain-containing protein [Planctomycetota bacterium]